MARQERLDLIRQLQQERGTKVVTYITGDRAPTPAQIGDDALRPLFDHLRETGHVETLDLFIYSRGGAIDVPWRIVSSLRRASDNWNILVPFRAQSAATLIAMGADEIVLGPQGELGPIDPIMSIQRMMSQPGGGQGTLVQDTVSVEDVMAYTRFVKQRVGLSDQQVLSASLAKLTERIDAVALGNVYRTHSHIRDVARRILLSRKDPAKEQTLATIIETLAERVYAHGHAIGLSDALEVGLPVRAATPKEDELMWKLLEVYERDMKLRDPVDPAAAVAQNDRYTEVSTIAIVESEIAAYTFTGELEVRARRQMPPQLNVNMNLNLQLPPNINPAQLPQQVQQVLQQAVQAAQQAVLQQAQQAVQQALQQQAPLVGVEASFRKGRWIREP